MLRRGYDMKDQKAIIIKNVYLRRQLFNYYCKSETKYPLDDFWWVFFKLHPEVKKATIEVHGRFPVLLYLAVVN